MDRDAGEQISPVGSRVGCSYNSAHCSPIVSIEAGYLCWVFPLDEPINQCIDKEVGAQVAPGG